MKTYTKPVIKLKKLSVELTLYELQLIRRLRQLRNQGMTRAEVEIVGDGPKVAEVRG